MYTKNSNMPSKKKKKFSQKKGIVSSEVRDWGNDPFVLRGVENAKKVIAKYGFPKEWIEEAKSNKEEKNH